MTVGGLPLRDDLRGRTPYGAPQLDVPVRLNVNENPFPPSAEVARAIGDAVARVAIGLNRYPDRDATVLRVALAAYLGHGLGTERVWAANGSNEIMLQLLQAFGGPERVALGFSPTYSMYPDYCRDTFTRYVTAPRSSTFEVEPEAAVSAIATHSPSVVLLASPNNPTGTALPLSTVRTVCEASDGIVVVDEAYAEFRRADTPSALTLLDEFPRLVVTRTMSKAFALAGARVGYLAASAEVVDAVQLVRLPYHLSSVTQAVALAALQHSEGLLGRVDELRNERDAMVGWLRSRRYVVAESDANFVLFGRFADRHAVWRSLLDQGVLVRETGPDGWLRVSIGTPAENQAFRNALQTAVPTAGEEIPA
ncbi:MAG: histidinol-phosphate transaminase [Actinomycetes bacterium]